MRCTKSRASSTLPPRHATQCNATQRNETLHLKPILLVHYARLRCRTKLSTHRNRGGHATYDLVHVLFGTLLTQTPLQTESPIMALENVADQIDSLLEAGHYPEARSLIALHSSSRAAAQYLALLNVLAASNEPLKMLELHGKTSLSEVDIRKAFR